MQVSSEVINLPVVYIVHIVCKFHLKLPICAHHVQIAPERQLIKKVIYLFVEILIKIAFRPSNKAADETKRLKLSKDLKMS